MSFNGTTSSWGSKTSLGEGVLAPHPHVYHSPLLVPSDHLFVQIWGAVPSGSRGLFLLGGRLRGRGLDSGNCLGKNCLDVRILLLHIMGKK